MNVTRGLRRIWLVATIGWALFVLVYAAWNTQRDVNAANELLDQAALAQCKANGTTDLRCYWQKLEANRLTRDTFAQRVYRLVSSEGINGVAGWLMIFAAVTMLPSALIYGLGALAYWIAKGFISPS